MRAAGTPACEAVTYEVLSALAPGCIAAEERGCLGLSALGTSQLSLLARILCKGRLV